MTESLRTIAVGFDGSHDAETAVRWSMKLAGETNANVVVVNAVGMLGRFDNPTVAFKLEDSVRRLADEYGLDTTRVTLHVDDGDACSVMMRMAEEPINASMLVVGSRGQGKHPGLLLGSTSLELAEHTTIPLVIVPR